MHCHCENLLAVQALGKGALRPPTHPPALGMRNDQEPGHTGTWRSPHWSPGPSPGSEVSSHSLGVCGQEQRQVPITRCDLGPRWAGLPLSAPGLLLLLT